MSWRLEVGVLLLMGATAACSSAPAEREPLIVRDARGAQQLEMMRQQEIVASSSAPINAKIEAHVQLGKQLLTTSQEDREAQAKKHLRAATTLWSRHQRRLSPPAQKHARTFVAQSYFYQGELAGQALHMMEPSVTVPSHAHYRQASQAFSDAFRLYTNATYHAQEAKERRWLVASAYRQGALLEQLARVTAQYSDNPSYDQQGRQRRFLQQALTHYKRAYTTELSEQDVEGLRWRRFAGERMCKLDKTSCVSQ